MALSTMQQLARKTARQTKKAEARQSKRIQIRRAVRRNRLSPMQAAVARGALSETSTPMSVGPIVFGAPGTVAVTKQVARFIPPGSTLWVSGMGIGGTVDSVVVDGINIFTDGAVDALFLDPQSFHAEGIIIPGEIKQSIVVTATRVAAGAATALATLVAQSIEIEDILDQAADCACDD